MKRFTTSSSAFYDSDLKIELPRQIDFLLCQRCFWCVSCIRLHKCKITECPCCNSVRLESIPISEEEEYRFDYHPKTGVTLEFSKIAGYNGRKT